jgi:hypothetical protein
MPSKNFRVLSGTDESEYLETNLTRTFGLGDLNERILLAGWALPEENHIWNDGIEASLIIRMRTLPPMQVSLKIEGLPFIEQSVKRQDVTLYVNGYRIGFWRLNTREKYFLHAEIEPEHWLVRNGDAYAKCVWHLPHSTRPCEITGAEAITIVEHQGIGS